MSVSFQKYPCSALKKGALTSFHKWPHWMDRSLSLRSPISSAQVATWVLQLRVLFKTMLQLEIHLVNQKIVKPILWVVGSFFPLFQKSNLGAFNPSESWPQQMGNKWAAKILIMRSTKMYHKNMGNIGQQRGFSLSHSSLFQNPTLSSPGFKKALSYSFFWLGSSGPKNVSPTRTWTWRQRSPYIEIAGNWMLAMLVMLAWYHNDVFQRANFQSERQDPSGNGTARHSMTDPSDP